MSEDGQRCDHSLVIVGRHRVCRECATAYMAVTPPPRLILLSQRGAIWGLLEEYVALAARPAPDARDAEIREYRSLLECTVFALEWLILHHVIQDGGKDWTSTLDGSAFFACDCSEDGGYMERDTNAYIHTDRCSSGFEDSLKALLDQARAALSAAPGATGGEAES